MKKPIIILFALLVLSLTSSLGFACNYILTDLGTLGRSSSAAYGINNKGQVVGHFDIPPVGDQWRGPWHGFLYTGHSMEDLGAPGKGGISEATGINDSGQVVLTAYSADPYVDWHAYLYYGDNMQDLGTLGGGQSQAKGINNFGQVVGGSQITDSRYRHHAFLYSEGSMKDLGALGAGGSFAYGINDAGQVVGYTSTEDNKVHAFIYNDGKMQDIGTLGGTCSYARGINNNGQVVGYSYVINESGGDAAYHAFLYTEGKMQDLGAIGVGPLAEYSVNWSEAYAINQNGQVVGITYTNTSNHWSADHAFLYSGGKMQDLNSLVCGSDWTIVHAYGINDIGQIIGEALPANGGDGHAVLLTPSSCAPLVPLPGILPLLLD